MKKSAEIISEFQQIVTITNSDYNKFLYKHNNYYITVILIGFCVYTIVCVKLYSIKKFLPVLMP